MPETTLEERLEQALAAIPLIDPHSHIDPHAPVAKSLDDLLGYHYYTELAHSAGMSHQPLSKDTPPQERVKAILQYAQRFENTVQWSWFVELCQTFFGWKHDRITPKDADKLWEQADKQLNQPDWVEKVIGITNLQKVYLTNAFDDDLSKFDTARYVPCLRTDDLVFHWHQPAVQERLQKKTAMKVGDATSLKRAIEVLFRDFISHGARACAISLPPDFTPHEVSEAELSQSMKEGNREVTAAGIFWLLTHHCRTFGLPFDLMIGVNRQVYRNGVYQGQDLFDQRTSLIQYTPLFNSFPEVKFCISVLTSRQNQELASYSWIFPNVYTNGHWWYSNIPTLIEADLTLRLEAVPANKQIGYYSDAYKLEFILPKFNMYRKCLAKVLSQRFVIEQKWSEERAVALGEQLLRQTTLDVFEKHTK